jgi:hypothetical protein
MPNFPPRAWHRFKRAEGRVKMADTNRDVAWRAPASDSQRPRFAALLLDNCGTIVRGGHAAASMFRAKPWMLERTAMRSLIADLPLSNTSPSYSARHLVYLSSEARWHRFHARDVFGQSFAVELFVSRRSGGERPMFLFRLRLPERA